MQKLFQSVRALQLRLLEHGILSIVIGGVAVAVWGEPRLTRDIDLKILLGRQEVDRLLKVLSSGYQSLKPDPGGTLRKHGLIFVQDPAGVRLDILLADTPYDVIAIQRGSDVEVQPGVVIRICSPEDLIIYKLISTRLRDHDDVRTVIRRQGDLLDDSYILDWLRQFEQALNDSTLVAEYQDLRRELREK